MFRRASFYLHVFVIYVIFLVSCTYTWKATPVSNRRIVTCNSTGKFPQLVQLPIFDHSWQVVGSCEQYPQEPVVVALLVFYAEWCVKFGDQYGKLWFALNKILIDWTPAEKAGDAYDVAGNSVHNARFGGVTLTPTIMWVHPWQDAPICKTSLIHELVHIALWNLMPDSGGDADHEGTKYLGWSREHTVFIQKVNSHLCLLGI